jgi:hypothetical protein
MNFVTDVFILIYSGGWGSEVHKTFKGAASYKNLKTPATSKTMSPAKMRECNVYCVTQVVKTLLITYINNTCCKIVNKRSIFTAVVYLNRAMQLLLATPLQFTSLNN